MHRYANFIDHSVTGQEDLLLSFQELFTAPTARHVFSFALAAFIDLVDFSRIGGTQHLGQRVGAERPDAAVNGASPSLGVSLAHLAGLMVVFGALARAGLRRVD